MSSSFPPLIPPDTPIMLYIGAGFDLSPLLTFAPGGPPYPIVPLSTPSSRPLQQPYTYTSFVFVDAKPRHTFAYMIPDFKEWKTEDARVRNVLHYSQGMLDRWRTIPGVPDLILFEGGGTTHQHQERLQDPSWHFSKTSPKRKRSILRSRSVGPREAREEKERQRPLTTLYYLFNTLDVEIMRVPRMERLWERVEALYVHGLKIHPRTGAGLEVAGWGTGAGSLDTSFNSENPLPLSKSLKRCFVLVGSWSGKGGVKDVDFVRQAREYERLRQTQMHSLHSHLYAYRSPYRDAYPTFTNTRPQYAHLFRYPSSSSSTEPSPSSSVSSLSLAPITFYRPRVRGRKGRQYSPPSVTLPYDLSFTSDKEEAENISPVLNEWDSADEDVSSPPCSPSFSFAPLSPLSSLDDLSLELESFHVPIPQIAYSHKLWRNGCGSGVNVGKKGRERGRYFVMRSVSECVEMVSAREKAEARERTEERY